MTREILARPGGAPGAVADQAGDATPVLALRDVSKRWGGHPVLDQANLMLDAGLCASVTGRNGVGKTTLLRIIAGLLEPDGGTITLDGMRHGHERVEYQRRLGYVSSGDGGLYARLTVRQNLDLWAGLTLLPRSRRRTAVERSLARFKLESLASRRADRLSLGQRQRVRLTAAFLHEPRLVILDEPFSSLDDDGVELLVAAIADLTGRGGSALACAPGGREGVSFDRDYTFEQGRLQAA